MRRNGIVCLLFFLSGAAALVYEISWSRQIGLLFGHTVHAAAVVLGSYFAGLAIGYAIGGKYARRVNPLAAYGIVEIVAAVWALCFPTLLQEIQTAGWLPLLTSSDPNAQSLLRGGACFLLLIPATAALGTTLPFIAEYFSRQKQSGFGLTSLAYGLNTLGAVVGVLSSSIILLVHVGVTRSSYLAAAISAACGVVALIVSRGEISRRSISQSAGAAVDIKQPSARGAWIWTLIAGLSGFATLALEVLYTRMFSLVFQNSTYTFGIVVAVFLTGLAIGAFLTSLLTRVSSAERLIPWAAGLAGVGVLGSVILFMRRTGMNYFSSQGEFSEYIAGAVGLVSFVVWFPVLMAGLVLPLVWKVVWPSDAGGRMIGRLTMVNTIAAAAGSIAASFVLLPTLGLWSAFAVVVGAFWMIVLLSSIFSRHWVSGGALSVACLLSIGLLISNQSRWRQPDDFDDEIVQRWESAYGWIDVVVERDSRYGDVWKVRQNLHYTHGASGDNSPRERRQAHIPLLLHPDPHHVLFLGLGTGVTAAGALSHPHLERIEIVELIPEVVLAADMLREYNDGVITNERVTMRIDDARHYLLQTDQQYDAIIADLFVPWESQTGYLYTVEHYEAAKARLRPGGLFCQWLPLYQVGAKEFEMIADSFAHVFPHTTIWWCRLNKSKPMLGLVGTFEPIEIDREALSVRLREVFADPDHSDPYLRTPDDLLELALGRWERRETAWLNTDEFPRVEFLAPVTHRNRELLGNDNLQDYFKYVLTTLPPVFGEGPNEAAEAQRVILFPELDADDLPM
jgi:spermidine synthase